MCYFRPTHPLIFNFHYFFYFYLFILFVIIIIIIIITIITIIILYIYIFFFLSPLSSFFSSTYRHPPTLSLSFHTSPTSPHAPLTFLLSFFFISFYFSSSCPYLSTLFPFCPFAFFLFLF